MRHALLAVALLGLALLARAGSPETKKPAPQFTADNRLLQPEGYRDWIYLSTGYGMGYSTPSGMEGPAAAAKRPQFFDTVFVDPAAYREFLKTGQWPDKTIFVLEVRAAADKVSIDQRGYTQGELLALEAAVKDVSRFPEKWAYFGFMEGGKLQATAEALPQSGCWSCHNKNGGVDNTFVQFYPTLRPVAEAKGTFRKEVMERAGH